MTRRLALVVLVTLMVLAGFGQQVVHHHANSKHVVLAAVAPPIVETTTTTGPPVTTTTTTAAPTTTTARVQPKTVRNQSSATRGARLPTTTTAVPVSNEVLKSACADSTGTVSSNHGLGECLTPFWWDDPAQFQCLDVLWGHLESGWNQHADNPYSEAYGIPQANPGSKMRGDWRNDVRQQIVWGLNYVRDTYGTPCKAKAHRLSAGSY